MILGVHKEGSDPEDVLETYSFNFTYLDNKVNTCQMAQNSKSVEKVLELCTDPKAVLQSAMQMIRGTLRLVQMLDPLPGEIELSMKLLYYEEVTPQDYEPPGFGPSVNEGYNFDGNAFDVNIGKVSTPFHLLTFNCRTHSIQFDPSRELPDTPENADLESEIDCIWDQIPSEESPSVSTQCDWMLEEQKSEGCDDCIPSSQSPVSSFPYLRQKSAMCMSVPSPDMFAESLEPVFMVEVPEASPDMLAEPMLGLTKLDAPEPSPGFSEYLEPVLMVEEPEANPDVLTEPMLGVTKVDAPEASPDMLAEPMLGVTKIDAPEASPDMLAEPMLGATKIDAPEASPDMLAEPMLGVTKVDAPEASPDMLAEPMLGATKIDAPEPSAGFSAEMGANTYEPPPCTCACGYDRQMGLVTLCNVCLSWSHAACYGFKEEREIPRSFVCLQCHNEINGMLCADTRLLTLEPNQRQEVCVYRRALVLCQEMELVSAAKLSREMYIDRTTIADRIVARLEADNIIKKSKLKSASRVVNQEMLRNNVLEQYFGPSATLGLDLNTEEEKSTKTVQEMQLATPLTRLRKRNLLEESATAAKKKLPAKRRSSTQREKLMLKRLR